MVVVIENPIKKKKRAAKKRVVKKTASATPLPTPKPSPARRDHFNSVAKSVGTACVIMTALVITIAPASIWILGPVIGAMAIFGIAMGYFASK